MSIIDDLMEIGRLGPEKRRDVEYDLASAMASRDNRGRVNWCRHFPWLRSRLSELQQNRCCWCDSVMEETVAPIPVRKERVSVSRSTRQHGKLVFVSLRNREFEVDPLRPTLEHIIPLSEGGADEPDNLSVACFGCNSSRRDNPAVKRQRQLVCHTP